MDAFVRDADKGGLGLSALERRADLRFAGLPAARLTAELPHESGRTARFDWTFVQTGPSRFILVQFLADRDRWPAKTFADVTASFEIKTRPISRSIRSTPSASARPSSIDSTRVS